MIEKIKLLWSSIRVRTIILSGIALWLQDIVANGFSWQALLKVVAGILLTITGIGTIDKFGNNLKKTDEEIPVKVINE